MVRASVVPALLVCFGLVGQTPETGKVMSLSLRDALKLAMQNHLQVSIAEETRKATQADVLTNEGAFDWNLAASASVNHLKSGSKGTASSPNGLPYLIHSNRDSFNRSLGVEVSKAFVWGGSVDMSYAPAYSYTKSRITNVTGAVDANGIPYPSYSTTTNAPYTGTFTATYTQSLLKGFGTSVTTANLVVARKNAEAADYQYQQQIIALVASIEGQYWDAVYAEKDLANKRTSLELAQKQLKENTLRVEVGTMAPIEVTSAEAQVAKAEQDIIAGEAQVRNTQDALRRALFPSDTQIAQVQPTDAPDLPHIALEEDAAVKMALSRRVELKGLKLSREISKVRESVAKDRTRPQLDAFVAYNGNTGDGYDTLSSVNTDLTGFKYPGYTVGLKFAMPIQNRAAKGALSAARANTRSSDLALRDQEQSIALEARNALRSVTAAEAGIKAAAKTRYYQERNLEAERKKFENGMSTNFVVLQTMTNLDNARSAELSAQITYAKAVTTLEKAVGNLMEARNFTVK